MSNGRKTTTGKPTSLQRDMGRLVKQAREQAGLSQAQLANQIKRRQASVSDIENGKMEIDASTLVQLAAALSRPITYFFPSWTLQALQPETLTPEEQNLLLYTQRLSKEDLRRLLVQVRALAEQEQREFFDWLEEEEERHM